MSNTENLRQQVQLLCDRLNKAGIKEEMGGEFLEWDAGSNPKSVFGGGICWNKEAFLYLKNEGLIDIGVCWKCGNEPITGDYTFTAQPKISYASYPICESCFMNGKKVKTGMGEFKQEYKMHFNSEDINNADNADSGGIPIGKIVFILFAVIGWFIITIPFTDYYYIGDEELLTNASWLSLIVITAVYIILLKAIWHKIKNTTG